MKPTIRTMQPNPHGVIPGTQAKEFFEKSRLPIQVRLSETVIEDSDNDDDDDVRSSGRSGNCLT